MHCCAVDLIFIDSWHGHLEGLCFVKREGGREEDSLTSGVEFGWNA